MANKTPIIMLSTLALQDSDSLNGMIASSLLEHIMDLHEISIVEVARVCNVANSSVSRFCKDVGLKNFAELKGMILGAQEYYKDLKSEKDKVIKKEQYLDEASRNLMVLKQNVDMQLLNHLCYDISTYENVYLLGISKSSAAAMCLHEDLLAYGKNVQYRHTLGAQRECLRTATNKDLLIIFSHSGTYFDTVFNHLPEVLIQPRIYYITAQNLKPNEYINYVIHYDCEDSAYRIYSMLGIAGVIARKYAKYI